MLNACIYENTWGRSKLFGLHVWGFPTNGGQKSGVKMCHFIMVDFNKGINIIFLKRFCNVGHSGTVLHAAGGSSSAHARNIQANMRVPKKTIILMSNIKGEGN